jgi:uncharacterized protein (TIGR01244 family)
MAQQIQIQIDDQITVGGQPDAQQLEQLARDGFQTIVNMQTAGEEDQPLSPREVGDKVRQLGLQYKHFPVSRETMSPGRVDQFREMLTHCATPVFVHCSSGQRSGAFVVMDRAVKQGWMADETLAQADSMGFECDVPEIKTMVTRYVENRTC